MEVFRKLADAPPAPEGRAIAVGTFDGVHLGHRGVIRSALDWGRSHGARVTVVTFDPHPLEVLQPDDPPRLLSSTAVKADLIAELGVDELVVIPFTPEFSRLGADDFCQEVLAGTLGARQVSVGENFRFGRGARGDARLLRSRAEFEAAIVPIVEHAGGPVSSTRIRELLDRGDVVSANELLGAPFQLEGIVARGDGRGRSLGTPTANLMPAKNLLVPGAGIYAGHALGHPAAISIGVRPTFKDDAAMLVEAHVLDFDGDLYGDTLRLAFLERLRDEIRFDSADELVEQMRRDVEKTRFLLSRKNREL
jgi:riboflavin kinase / FMN adenylyltransferase